jgi:hypothetical protein
MCSAAESTCSRAVELTALGEALDWADDGGDQVVRLPTCQ